MAEWYHRLSGHEFEQGKDREVEVLQAIGLQRESDMTEQLNNNISKYEVGC